MKIFYNGQNKATQGTVDVAVTRTGELMSKMYTQIKDTLDSMSRNHKKWEDNNFGLHYRKR